MCWKLRLGNGSDGPTVWEFVLVLRGGCVQSALRVRLFLAIRSSSDILALASKARGSTSRFIQLRGGHKGGSSFLGLGTSGVGVWSHCEAVEASDAARVLMRFAPRWHKLTTALSPAGVASCAVGESGRDADGHQGVQPNAQVLHRPSHPPCRWPIQRCDSRAQPPWAQR